MSEGKNQGGAERSSGALNPRDLYRAFFEGAPDGMLATDPHGRFVVVNRRASLLTGYSPEELLGMTIGDLVHPEDLARDPIGIRPEDLDTLFKPFRQVDTGTTRQYEGTGLGLSICKRLAERMGGSIQVASEWGQGSRFTFSLPLERTPA